jgi:hypothetical protein
VVSIRLRDVQVYSRVLYQVGVIMYFKFMCLLNEFSGKKMRKNKRYPNYSKTLFDKNIKKWALENIKGQQKV